MTTPKKAAGLISEAKKLGSRKCHFAMMTQALLDQADGTGALQMAWEVKS
jgi:hypothetical protein